MKKTLNLLKINQIISKKPFFLKNYMTNFEKSKKLTNENNLTAKNNFYFMINMFSKKLRNRPSLIRISDF